MAERISNFYTDGTAALDFSATAANRSARILSFPRPQERASYAKQESRNTSWSLASLISSAKLTIMRIAYASEMFCSLKFEDFRGVPFGMLEKKHITALAAFGFTVAVLALVFGA